MLHKPIAASSVELNTYDNNNTTLVLHPCFYPGAFLQEQLETEKKRRFESTGATMTCFYANDLRMTCE